MTLALMIFIPVFLIVITTKALKLKWPMAVIPIAILSVASTYAADFVYCNCCDHVCEPDPLNAIGYIIHSIAVFILSCAIDLIDRSFKQDLGTKRN